jgi:hypothetical protein
MAAALAKLPQMSTKERTTMKRTLRDRARILRDNPKVTVSKGPKAAFVCAMKPGRVPQVIRESPIMRIAESVSREWVGKGSVQIWAIMHLLEARLAATASRTKGNIGSR